MVEEPTDAETAALLKDLTIVIFSAHRHKMLRNIVEYWSKWPVHLIILDGSEIPIQPDSLGEGIASIDFLAEVDLSQRLLFASSTVQTKYACLHADDDYVLPHAAAKAIKFLSTNTDFTCVGSDIQTFRDSDRKGYAREMAKFYPWYESGRTIASGTPYGRIIEHFSDYRFAYFYGIHRSTGFRAGLESVALSYQRAEIAGIPRNLAAQIELGFELFSAAVGRLGNIPWVFLLKRVGNESPPEVNCATWLTLPKNTQSVDGWRNDLGVRLALFLHEDSSSVSDWLKQGLDMFLRAESEVLGVRKLHQTGQKQSVLKKLVHYFSRPSRRSYNGDRSLALANATDSARVFVYHSLRRIYRAVMALAGRPRVTGGFAASSAKWAFPKDIVEFEGSFPTVGATQFPSPPGST